MHITRRAEEIDSMLISEYANPPAVLAERVLNAGYLALHRPPRADRARDVLAAGFLPGPLRRRLSGDFVKACWFLAMSRLGLLLWQSGLEASEFRWTEGDERGGARTCSFLLDGLPEPPQRGPVEESGFRGAFLRALDWLPAFLDTRDAFRTLRELRPEDLRRRDVASLTRWASAAWGRQREHPAWRIPHRPEAEAPRGLARRPLPAEDFSVVHLMLCLPAELHPASRQDASASLGRLHASFGLDRLPGRSVSILWVPEAIEDLASWRYQLRGRAAERLFAEDSAPDEHQVASRLVASWLEHLYREVWRAA